MERNPGACGYDIDFYQFERPKLQDKTLKPHNRITA
jgi:hypothetical protein